MDKNRSIPFIIISVILISIIYLILAAKPLPKEYQFQPQWKINITKEAQAAEENEKQIYFRLGNALGYFTADGKITCYKTFPSKASISNNYFTCYGNSAKNTTFYDYNGSAKGVINYEGLPYIVEDRIYVMLPGGNSFIKCDSDGNRQWKYEGIMPLTAFSSKKQFTAAGFADGSIQIFNNESGQAEIVFAPGGSDLPVILGLDISDDGSYIAAVSGHNKQRFVLAHREENQPKIIFHTFVDSSGTNQSLVHFCTDRSRVIYCLKDAIGIYDFKKNRNNFIKIDTKIISIRESGTLVFLLGKKGREYKVYIVEKTNTLEGSFSFTAGNAFIQADKNSFYLGKDDSISKISLERK